MGLLSKYLPRIKKCVISAFKTQLFSVPLQNILEIEIDSELLHNTVNFWNFFEKSICLPKAYINDNKISALIDTGASTCVISLKLSKAEIIRSLKLVFRPHDSLGFTEDENGKWSRFKPVRINESE